MRLSGAIPGATETLKRCPDTATSARSGNDSKRLKENRGTPLRAVQFLAELIELFDCGVLLVQGCVQKREHGIGVLLGDFLSECELLGEALCFGERVDAVRLFPLSFFRRQHSSSPRERRLAIHRRGRRGLPARARFLSRSRDRLEKVRQSSNGTRRGRPHSGKRSRSRTRERARGSRVRMEGDGCDAIPRESLRRREAGALDALRRTLRA